MEYNNDNIVSNENDYSVFAKGLIIEGDVTLVTPLIAKGEIKGNLTCEREIEIDDGAIITGNVSGSSITLLSGVISGDVNAAGNVLVEADSKIKGNVTGGVISINGLVEGNVTSSSEVVLSSEARIFGDITATYIDIEKGAKILGAINIGEKETGNTMNNVVIDRE